MVPNDFALIIRILRLYHQTIGAKNVIRYTLHYTYTMCTSKNITCNIIIIQYLTFIPFNNIQVIAICSGSIIAGTD